MASASAIALDHQARLIAINTTATSRALILWQRMNFDTLDASWAILAPAMLQQSNAAQLAAAKTSDGYVSSLSSAYEFDQDAARIIPESFVGLDGSGRPMESLLHGAVTTTKEAVGSGFGRVQSLEAGASYLAAMYKTGLADLGRAADLTASTGKGYTHYVRVVNPGACSRCAILAGKDSFQNAFKRHPACKCTTAPVVMDGTITPPGLHSSPDDHFASLSTTEQDRIYTKGGAEAIRSGAKVQDVVNSRRGAAGISTSNGIGRQTAANSGRRMTRTRIGTDAAGNPIMGYTTTEGTYRGNFRSTQNRIGVGSQRINGNRYSAAKRVRLMPESIVGMTDDLPTRQLLLRDAGYLDYPITNTSTNAWIAEQKALKIADRAAADDFYRSAGIQLG
jgi:hypothetical protein